MPDTNLTLGKFAGASSYQNTSGNVHPPSHANDGSMTTRWAAGDATFPQWWSVDLGAVYTLSKVDIYWYIAASRYSQYKIDISEDNVNFRTVVNRMDNTTMGNTSDSFSASARYVRVTIYLVNTGWASANEIQVYGH